MIFEDPFQPKVFYGSMILQFKWCWWLLWFPAAQQGTFSSRTLSSLLSAPIMALAWPLSQPWSEWRRAMCALLLLLLHWRDSQEVIQITMSVMLDFIIPLLEIPLSTLGISLPYSLLGLWHTARVQAALSLLCSYNISWSNGGLNSSAAKATLCSFMVEFPLD